MGYKEEIFERLEISGLRTKSEISSWLAGPKRKSSSYSNFATQLQEPFAIREEIERTEDFDELKKLKKEAETTSIKNNKTIRLAEEKMNKVSKELTKITEQRREARLKEEAEERKQESINKRRDDIQKDLDRIRDLDDVSKVNRRIKSLSDEANVSDLESQIEGIKIGIEQQISENIRKSKEANLNSSDRRKRDNAKRWLKEHSE